MAFTFDPLEISKHEEIVSSLNTLGAAFASISNFDDIDLSGLAIGQGLSWNGTQFVASTVGGLQTGDNVSSLVNDAGYQTLAQVQAEIAALVDTAPAALDTLNELAAAIGDDPNFATTITTQLAGKADTVHTHVISDITDFPTLAAVATSGDYNDLSNLPTLGAIADQNDTDGVPEGATNLYFTDTRVAANVAVVLNTAKVSADGSIGTHSDVDITTTPPAAGQVLSWDGTNFVPANAGVDTNMFTGNLTNAFGDVSHDGGGNAYTLTNNSNLSLQATTSSVLQAGTSGASETFVTLTAAAAFLTQSDGVTTNILTLNGGGFNASLSAGDTFVASFGGTTRLSVADNGDTVLSGYPSTRDDTGTFTPANLAYFGAAGELYAAPVASILGSIDNHTDVDTTTAAPATGDVLRYDGTNWTPATLYALWQVWAEESANLNAGSFEFSFGNSDDGDIGVLTSSAIEITHVWIQADNVNGTGSCTVTVTLDGVDSTASVSITAGGATDVVAVLGTPLSVGAGVRVGFRTTAYVGTVGSVRVGADGRIPLIVG